MGMQEDEILMNQMLMDAPVEMPSDEPVEMPPDEPVETQPEAPEELLPEEDLFRLLGLKEEEPDKLEALKEAAQAGDTDAMMALGKIYTEGDGVEEDFAEACYWYEKSEDATGFWRIGSAYKDMENMELAEEYYHKAVEAKTDKYETGRFWGYTDLTLICLGRNPYEAEKYLNEASSFTEVPEEMYDVLYTFAYMLALVLEKKGDKAKAISWYEFALDTKDQEKAEEIGHHLLVLAAGVLKEAEGDLEDKAVPALETLMSRNNRGAAMQLVMYWLQHREKDEDGTELSSVMHTAACLEVPFANYFLAKEYMGLSHMCSDITPSVREAELYFRGSTQWFEDAEDGAEIKRHMEHWLEKMKREEQNR